MPPVDSSESTSAFTDRLKVLYIRKSIPRSEWILDLEEKFLEERDIIFSLAVKELRELVENKFEFIIPADTTTFMVDYNSHLNTIGQFVSDRCELGSANKEHKRDLLACYKEYAKANAFTSIATDDIFFDAITKIEGVKKSKIWNNGCSLAGYWGIKLKSNCFDIPPEEDVNESS